MNARRAQDLIRHIIQDKDYGAKMMSQISAAESIYVVNQILPDCIKKAEEKDNQNDIGYFSEMKRKYRPIVIEKIKIATQLWVAYCSTTGYPYYVDGDMLVLFDYTNHEKVAEPLKAAGFDITFQSVDPVHFKNEVGHMYRNGYQSIRFLDGKCEPFVVPREELYEYDEFFNDDYMTNPGLQASMINFFQEFRKKAAMEGREELLKTREDQMIVALQNAEYMVPCVKEENENEVEISHPYIDLTDRVTDKKEGEQVIAIPAFTDGFEMEKCYQGHHENMLYKYNELVGLVEELGASGVIFNCLGVSYYMKKELLQKVK